MDRSSARIPYHPPAKRSPVPTLLLPVSVLEATALTNFRAVTGAFFNLLQLPTQGQAPHTPRRLLCPRGRPAWLVSPRGGLPSSEPMKMTTCTVIVNCRYRCASLSSPSALRLVPASAPDVLRGWLVFGDTQLLLCPIAKLGACARPPARPRSPAHSRSCPGRCGTDAREPSSVLQSLAGGWPLTSAHNLASSPSTRRGGKEARPRPMPAPPLGPSAATWRRHGHSASLGLPPEGGGAPRPSPPCRDIGGCGGPTHALVPSPSRDGRTWLMLYLNATGFEARAVRTPRNAPSLVIGAGRVRARPRGQSRLGLEALRVHSGAPHTRPGARTPGRSAWVAGLRSPASPRQPEAREPALQQPLCLRTPPPRLASRPGSVRGWDRLS